MGKEYAKATSDKIEQLLHKEIEEIKEIFPSSASSYSHFGKTIVYQFNTDTAKTGRYGRTLPSKTMETRRAFYLYLACKRRCKTAAVWNY